MVPAKRPVDFTPVSLDLFASRQLTVSVSSSALAMMPGDVGNQGPFTVEHGQFVLATATASASASNAIRALNSATRRSRDRWTIPRHWDRDPA